MKKKALKAQDWFRLSNVESNATEAELQLFGGIGEWAEINHQDLVYQIEQLPDSVNKLVLTINSYGGEVYEGKAIYNALQRYKRKKNFSIESHVYFAGSMAGPVALVGDKIIGYENTSKWHAHEVKGGAWGGASALRQTADEIEMENNDLAEMYAKRTGIEKETILKEWMAVGVEKYFSAKEALEIGLFDELVDFSQPLPSNCTTDADLHQHFNKILNVGTMPAQSTNTDMDLKQIKADLESKGLGLLVASVEDDKSLVAFISDLATENSTLKAEKETVSNELATLQAEAEAKAEADKTAKAEAMVNKAIEDKKIVASQKDIYVAQALADFEATETALNALSKPANIKAFVKEDKAPPAKKVDGLPVDREEWDYHQWAKHDSKALAQMKKDEPKKFQALLDSLKQK